MADETPAPEPELGWAPKDDRSLWSRMKEAIAGDQPGETPPSLPPVSTPKPRKARKTPFDKARAAKKESESRRTRLRRVAEEKRDGLALVVGESVEKVLVEKLETRDEEMHKLAQGFVNVSSVLGGLGRSLGAQEEHARAIEETLKRMPEAEREQAAALAGLAKALGAQTDTQGKVAQSLEGVPEIVSLVKQGSGTVQGQLLTLREVQRELELQREQRERVVTGVQRVERALLALGEQLQGFQAQKAAAHEESNARVERALAAIAHRIVGAAEAEDARFQEQRLREQESAARLERAVGAVTARLDLDAREAQERAQAERARAADQAERLERGLACMAARVHEQSSAIVGAQEEAAATFRRSQQAVVESFEEFQQRTFATMERLHEERLRESARGRRRASFVGGALATLCLGAIGWFGFAYVQAERQQADSAVAAERARAESAIGVARARAEALFEAQTARVETAPTTTVSDVTLPAGFAKKPVKVQ